MKYKRIIILTILVLTILSLFLSFRRNIMKYKRIIILTILVLTILSLFLSFVYAQVWVIEFSGAGLGYRIFS